MKRFYPFLLFVFFAALLPLSAEAQSFKEDSTFVANNYTKIDRQIQMRDGIKLYTCIYMPKDDSQSYPILMERTPYSCGPYGEDNYNYGGVGPSNALMKEKYIFVYQDVRGRYKSEGEFREMTPGITAKSPANATDESTDTYDTVDWLLKNLKNHNGKVGLWGISYPGFYASACLPNAHPAIVAVSPQAPVTDEFIGDDCNHNGAFFLLDNFNFLNYFDGKRNADSTSYDNLFSVRPKDTYAFFLKMGPVKNTQDSKYFGNKGKIWNEILKNDTYNEYWKSRNIRQHLKDIKPAVLVVGGWFDAEDLFGALNTYSSIERQSPGNKNFLVMGPWTHGAWAGRDWSRFGTHDFGSNTSNYYQEKVEAPFFNFYLKNKGMMTLQEATIFETGSNQWRSFAQWPPENIDRQPYYFAKDQLLTAKKPTDTNGFEEYLSDPNKPVPYTAGVYGWRNNQYLVEDQRFATQRPDVLSFMTEVLTEDLTLAGAIEANLFVSTTGTDADFVVKLIDVLPDSTSNPRPNPTNVQMGGYQRMVRAEVFRGKFRKSFEKPEAFVPNKVAEVKVNLNDVAHVFSKGHRIMVQIQSSWFPIVDRNPQKFMRIPEAKGSDFQKATIRVYDDAKHASHIVLPILKPLK